MKRKKINASSGQSSRILMILAVVVFLIIVIAYLSFYLASNKKANVIKNSLQVTPSQPAGPVYETTLSDIKLSIISSEDLGNTLKSDKAYQPDLTTTEKFIKVVVGAQNKGKMDIPQYSWDVGDIVDSDGRHYISIDDKAYNFLPRPDLCGALLKPEFDPTPCVKYYEVSKVSTGLRVTVKSTGNKKQEALLDLLH